MYQRLKEARRLLYQVWETHADGRTCNHCGATRPFGTPFKHEENCIVPQIMQWLLIVDPDVESTTLGNVKRQILTLREEMGEIPIPCPACDRGDGEHFKDCSFFSLMQLFRR